MAISAGQLASGLYQMIKQDPKQQQKIVDQFIAMVEEQGLIALLPHVVSHLEYYNRQDKKREQVHITLAQQHAAPVVAAITKRINAPEKAEVVVAVDDSIQGGFIAQYNNVVYDGSIKNQLAQVAAHLTKY